MTTYYVDDGGSNTSPYDTLAKAANLLETIDALGLSAGDIVLVRDDHSESDAGHETYTFAAGVQIISIDASENYSPMSSSTGMLEATGVGDDTIFAHGVWKGLSFKTGDFFNHSTTDSNLIFIDCTFEITNAGNWFTYNGSRLQVTYINCTFTQYSTSDEPIVGAISDGSCIDFFGCTFVGTKAESFTFSGTAGRLVCIGCDFTAFGLTASLFEWVTSGTRETILKLLFCSLPDITITRPDSICNSSIVEAICCDDGDTFVTEKQTDVGYLITNTSVYKTGGFALPDPTDVSSWQIVSNTSLGTANNMETFHSPMIWTWNDDTTNKNASVEVLLTDTTSVTTPTTWDMGIYMFALGSASTPLWSCYEDVFPAVGDTGDGTGTSYSESGTNGDGWTGGGSTKKAFTITLPATQTIGRKGQVGVIFWCRNLAGNDAMYLNPQVTLST